MTYERATRGINSEGWKPRPNSRLEVPMWIGNIIIYRNLAYVPVMHTLSTGGWYTGEPVTVVPVAVADLARAIAKTQRAGNPPIAARTVALSADPILRSTGAPTWGRLAIYAASYEIDWADKAVHLQMSQLDDHGRFVADPAKEQRYPNDVTTETVAAAIVADWQARNAKSVAPLP